MPESIRDVRPNEGHHCFMSGVIDHVSLGDRLQQPFYIRKNARMIQDAFMIKLVAITMDLPVGKEQVELKLICHILGKNNLSHQRLVAIPMLTIPKQLSNY